MVPPAGRAVVDWAHRTSPGVPCQAPPGSATPAVAARASGPAALLSCSVEPVLGGCMPGAWPFGPDVSVVQKLAADRWMARLSCRARCSSPDTWPGWSGECPLFGHLVGSLRKTFLGCRLGRVAGLEARRPGRILALAL
jgi:hypothetical protein